LNLAKQISVEFEKGGKFVAALLDDEAPKTCKVVWDALPLECVAEHAQYSGQLMFWFTPTIRFDDLENPKLMGLCPGDIAFNTHALHKWHLQPPKVAAAQEIFFVYGMCTPADQCGPSPVNHFAKMIDGSLDELVAVGKRTRREGFEKVRMIRK
jgi:hypothetical protein